MSDDPAVPILVEALRAYLVAHPHAADTLRGITDSWLPGIAPRPTSSQVARALAVLAREVRVENFILPDGTEIWRAAP